MQYSKWQTENYIGWKWVRWEPGGGTVATNSSYSIKDTDLLTLINDSTNPYKTSIPSLSRIISIYIGACRGSNVVDYAGTYGFECTEGWSHAPSRLYYYCRSGQTAASIDFIVRYIM